MFDFKFFFYQFLYLLDDMCWVDPNNA